MSEYTPEQQGRLLGSAVEGVAWALIEYETDTSDRGVSEEHYRDAVKRARELLPTLVHPASVVSEEPDWEYGQSEVLTDGTVAFGRPVETLEEAVRRRDIDRINYPWPEELGVGRRRKAGPWLPVEQEGETDA